MQVLYVSMQQSGPDSLSKVLSITPECHTTGHMTSSLASHIDTGLTNLFTNLYVKYLKGCVMFCPETHSLNSGSNHYVMILMSDHHCSIIPYLPSYKFSSSSSSLSIYTVSLSTYTSSYFSYLSSSSSSYTTSSLLHLLDYSTRLHPAHPLLSTSLSTSPPHSCITSSFLHLFVPFSPLHSITGLLT